MSYLCTRGFPRYSVVCTRMFAAEVPLGHSLYFVIQCTVKRLRNFRGILSFIRIAITNSVALTWLLLETLYAKLAIGVLAEI